jgi:hypothetical protein
MKSRLFAIACLAAASASGGVAAASTLISFANTPATDGGTYTSHPVGFQSVTVGANADALLFDADLGANAFDHSPYAFIEDNAQIPSEDFPGGQNFLYYGGQVGQQLEITRPNGGAFNLDSLEMSQSWYSQTPQQPAYVTISWNGPDAGSEKLSLIQGFQNYTLNLIDVTYVYISTTQCPASAPGCQNATSYWGLDDLAVDFLAVPEPSTWAMMIGGFFGVGAMVRARRKRALGIASA